MSRKIKALLVMPNKEAQVVRIPTNIKFLKTLIGKELMEIKAFKDVRIIVNGSPNINDINRFIGNNMILDTFLVINSNKGGRSSLKKRQIRKYYNIFKLRKHEKKINYFREEYLKDYYANVDDKKLSA